MEKEIKKNILIEEIAEIKNNLRVSEKFRDCDLYNMMTATTKELLKIKEQELAKLINDASWKWGD